MNPRGKRTVALLMSFVLFAVVTGATLPAQAPEGEGGPAQESAANTPRVVERQMQSSARFEPRRILPAVLIGAAVVAGIFLLVLLVSKVKYDIGGSWDFHNTFSTPGNPDSDSVWTFTPFDTRNPIQGVYSHLSGSNTIQGTFTVVNKKEVVFYGANYEEEYLGQFDDKNTMSGTFTLISGAKGTWKAKRK